MSQVELRAIKLILASHFGDLIAAVGMTLAVKGPLPLPVIVQANNEIDSKNIKESLFVLIHHNLIKAFESPNQSHSMYKLDTDAVLMRLAYPVFCELVRKGCGPSVLVAFQEVFMHGRLSIEKLPVGLNRTSFDILLEKGYLEWIPLQSSSSTEAILTTTVKVEQRNSTFSDRTASSPTNKKRSVLGNDNNSPTKDPKKAKLLSATTADSTGYVCVKSSSLLKTLLYEKIVDYCERRINNSAGMMVSTILKSIIDGSNDSSTKATTFSSFQVATKLAKDIKLLVEYPDDPNGFGHKETAREKSAIAQYLNVFSQDFDFFIKEDNRSAGSLYRMDLKLASQTLCLAHTESFIKANFGQPSVRIFRILLDKKMLEEKTISKIAMITPKEARERLYQMLKIGLVSLQEVPKTIDHAPSRTFYLWHVPISRACSTMSNWCLKAMINLTERIKLERTKNHLLISKSERSDVAANPSLLCDSEQRQLSSLRSVLNRLVFNLNQVTNEWLLLRYLFNQKTLFDL